jgi:hypothetical protein
MHCTLKLILGFGPQNYSLSTFEHPSVDGIKIQPFVHSFHTHIPQDEGKICCLRCHFLTEAEGQF